MPSEVMYMANASVTGGRRLQSSSVFAETGSGSLTFLKKLWKEKKVDKRTVAIMEGEETSSSSPSPTLFRRNRRTSAVASPLMVSTPNTSNAALNNSSNNSMLSVKGDSQASSRSPSPSFLRGLGRRSSTTHEKTQENLLHYHVSHQDFHALEKLLSDPCETVDINYMRPPGVSALHQACSQGSIKIVKLLIQRGASVHLKTWTGLSPLKVAVLSGNYEVAQYLVEVGADSDDIKDGCQIEKSSSSPSTKRNKGGSPKSKRNNSF